MGVCTHVSTNTWTHACQHTNILVRSKKLEVRIKKLEVRRKKLEDRSKKLEIRKFTDCYIYIHVHTYTHTHAHTDTDPPQSIPLFFDNFWTLADFQDSGAN